MIHKVLIADNSTASQNSIEKTLDNYGYQVLTINDPATAIKTIKEFNPELVFLNTKVEDRTGYSICEEIKNEQSLQHIPVIIIFSENDSFDPSEARRAGAVRCLPKTIDSDALLIILGTLSKNSPSSEETIETRTYTTEEFDYEELLEIEPVDEIVSKRNSTTHSLAKVSSATGSHYIFEVNVEDPEEIAKSEEESKTLEEPTPYGESSSEQENESYEITQTMGTPTAPTNQPLKPVLFIELSENGQLLESFEVLDTYEPQEDLLNIREALISTFCAECGASVTVDDVFCIECGTARDEAISFKAAVSLCESCGEAIDDGDIFCLSCGLVLV